MNSPGNVAEMARGETALVSKILDTKFLSAFLEMGFVPDALVRCNFKAPMGDPICVHVSGHNLTLRHEEAALISIRAENVLDNAKAEDSLNG